MDKYESKQVQIHRPAATVFPAVSDFTNFTPMLRDHVEEWEATPRTCSFRAQGFRMALEMVECDPPKTVKVASVDPSPVQFTFWLQLHESAPDDTRMHLVLHAELPMMVKMMIGGKIRQALDQVAEKIAESFNNLPM